MPIDSSTRIASRATGRETAYSAEIDSMVSTAPGARAPVHQPRTPSASSTLAWSPGRDAVNGHVGILPVETSLE